MARTKLSMVTRTQGANANLTDGTVTLPGFELEFVDVPILVQAFTRMVRQLEFDVSEMAFTTYLTAKEHGTAFTALPIFLVRGLHHGAISTRVDSGVEQPKDIEGGLVGVGRGYTVTTGVWARDILDREYQVDLDSVTWMRSAPEHVTAYRLPDNVVTVPEDKRLDDMLIAGELAATVNVEVEHPQVRPLIPDADDAAIRSFTATGVYPINHVIVVKDELLEGRPELATALFDAFVRAKTAYVRRLREGDLRDRTDRVNARVMEASGGDDPLPYGIRGNEATIDALMEACMRQRILTRKPAYAEIFAAPTLGLSG